jgi:hypothetical protein
MRIRRNGLRTNISEENIQLLQDDLNTFKGLMLTSPMKEATHINNKLTNKWEIVTDKCSKPSRKLREQIPTPVIPITNRYNALHNLQNNPELPGELQNHYIKNQHIQKNVLSKQNKTKTSPKRRKKKILLIGDSHMHDCANELGKYLGPVYEITGTITPGSRFQNITKLAKNEIAGPSYGDAVIIWGGSRYCENIGSRN